MNVKEVCERLGISRATLHRRIDAGEIAPQPKNPGQKKHYRLLFDKNEVEKLVQQD